MARIYARRIRAGIMTLDEVPERWKAQTQKLLEGGE